jgi:primosomal replication protein N
MDNIKPRLRQYMLSASFLAMASSSPSVTKPRETLITSLMKLVDSGWYSSTTPEDLRSLFVRTMMGDFLKCFRCHSCGAQFIVNREPNKYTHKHYECPVCHRSEVRADDSFLKAMVSEEQMENVRRARQVQNENDQLKPFQVFFSVPCEICGQPITEWTERNIKPGIKGYGWGHLACWNTTKGIVILMAELTKRSRRPKR